MKFSTNYTKGSQIPNYDHRELGVKKLALTVIREALRDLQQPPSNLPRQQESIARQSAVDFFFNLDWEDSLTEWCQKAGVDPGAVRKRASEIIRA